MPPTPPELSRSYASSADKDADWQLLLDRAGELRELTKLSGIRESEWPDDASVARLRAVKSAAHEAPGERLARWRDVFAIEIADLERAVVAASSQGGSSAVADVDLLSAVYLASRLLATLYDLPMDRLSS